MFKLVILRHGESEWNKKGLFTGWTDVDLSDQGEREARLAGKKLKRAGFNCDLVYCSLLKRVTRTTNLVLEELDALWLPVIKDWRLNEKHYGNLQGLNKKEMVNKFGEKKVLLWRRSYNVRPPVISASNKYNQVKDRRYKDIKVPKTESLKDVVERVVPWWKQEVRKKILAKKSVLIIASGNSLRALVKYLENISETEIISLNIPTGIPLVYELDNNLKVKKKYYLASTKELRTSINRVVAQGLRK